MAWQQEAYNYFKEAEKSVNSNTDDIQHLHADLFLRLQEGDQTSALVAVPDEEEEESFLALKHSFKRAFIQNTGQTDIRIKYAGRYYLFESQQFYCMDSQEASFFMSKEYELFGTSDLEHVTAETWRAAASGTSAYYW